MNPYRILLRNKAINFFHRESKFSGVQASDFSLGHNLTVHELMPHYGIAPALLQINISSTPSNLDLHSGWAPLVSLSFSLPLLGFFLFLPFTHLHPLSLWREKKKTFIFERETEHKHGGAKKEGDNRIWSRLQVLSCQHRPDAGLKLTNHKSMTWAGVQRLIDWDTQEPQGKKKTLCNLWFH